MIPSSEWGLYLYDKIMIWSRDINCKAQKTLHAIFTPILQKFLKTIQLVSRIQLVYSAFP